MTQVIKPLPVHPSPEPDEIYCWTINFKFNIHFENKRWF